MDESFFVNKTALAELGKEVPTTWDEMLDCMRAYKEAHPNGTAFITYGWGLSYYDVLPGRYQQCHRPTSTTMARSGLIRC